MVKPSHLAAARKASDRSSRTRRMAEVMKERAASKGSCEIQDLRAAGFTDGEIFAYADDARALLSHRPPRPVKPDGRREGERLVRLARRIRACIDRRETAHG